jgi:hypothetical protein
MSTSPNEMTVSELRKALEPFGRKYRNSMRKKELVAALFDELAREEWRKVRQGEDYIPLDFNEAVDIFDEALMGKREAK